MCICSACEINDVAYLLTNAVSIFLLNAHKAIDDIV